MLDPILSILATCAHKKSAVSSRDRLASWSAAAASFAAVAGSGPAPAGAAAATVAVAVAVSGSAVLFAASRAASKTGEGKLLFQDMLRCALPSGLLATDAGASVRASQTHQ